MSSQGQTSVNFGSGALEATVVVTGQASITTANLVEAWCACNEAIGSQPNDGAWVEQMQATATRIVNATGFSIVVKPAIGQAYGTYNVNWVWN